MNKQSPNFLHAGRLTPPSRPLYFATSLLALTISLTGTLAALADVDGGEPGTGRENAPSCTTPDGSCKRLAAEPAPECGVVVGCAWGEPNRYYRGNAAYIALHSSLSIEQAEEVLDRYYMAVETALLDYPQLDSQREAVVAAFVRIARFESHWDATDRGSAGERGTLQTHPCHAASFRRAGLDMSSESDCCLYWARIVCARLAAGTSFWRAFRDWSVTRNRHAKTVKADWRHFMEVTAAQEEAR